MRKIDKRFKKLTFTLLAAVMSLQALFTNSVIAVQAASSDESDYENYELSNEDFDRMIEELENYLIVVDGHFEFENIPNTIQAEFGTETIEKMHEALDIVNDLADENKVIIGEDKSVTETLEYSKELNAKGGSTFRVTEWWGIRNFFSTASANTTIANLKKLNTAVAVFAGVCKMFGFAPGNVVGTVAKEYGKHLAFDMQNRNKQAGTRGIIVDMTWALIYTTKVQ